MKPNGVPDARPTMATPGTELLSPTGERLVFVQTARETGGALLELEATYAPNSAPPPEHVHPVQEERFRVLDGELTVYLDGAWRVYGPGEAFTVPPRTPHRMHNAGTAEARVAWEIRPALRTETFCETLWGLARDGKTDGHGVPNLLQVAVIAREYNREFRLTKPPYPVQRVLFTALAPLGRALGYRARYDAYSGPEEWRAVTQAP